MKRIIFDVPRWHAFLYREARGLGAAHSGDPPRLKLEDELFARLFAGDVETLPETDRERDLGSWAESFHGTCDQLPSFQRLADEVRGDAFAAACAVETIMDELQPEAPEDAPSLPPLPERRVLGRTCEKASEAVDALRESFDGVAGIGWGRGGGAVGSGDGKAAREAAKRIRNDPRLQRIALLAGRFKRVAVGRLHRRVRHGVDEVSDVSQGNEIARLLPLELARLVDARTRLAFLRDLSERACLQYEMRGPERLGRGPLVVCLDKSGSMDGPPDVWATAVALALLEVAHREARPFTVLSFNGAVKFEATVKPGEVLPEKALFVACSGGTDIGNVLHHALEIIGSSAGAARRSDVVLITDGQSDTATAPQLRARAAELDTEILGMGIGVSRDALAPWCDEAVTVTDLGTVDAAAADALFGE